MGRKPKHVDVEQRKLDTKAENDRGEIERRFAFLKMNKGLNLVNAKTAGTIMVTIDVAITLANLDKLLGLFAIPILLKVVENGGIYEISYRVWTKDRLNG